MPGSPLPTERMRMPSSMPAGIFTSSVFCDFSLPWRVALHARLGG